MTALHKQNSHATLTLQLHTHRLLVHAKLAADLENFILNVPRLHGGTSSVDRSLLLRLLIFSG